MNQELLLNISKDTFYFYYKSLSKEDLACILNNSVSIKDYLDMEITYLKKVPYKDIQLFYLLLYHINYGQYKLNHYH